MGSRYIFVLLPRYHHQGFNSIVRDLGVGDKRRLRKRCYGAAVEREQAKVTPLPFVLEAGSMERVTASVGRCGLCGLEEATWNGEASGQVLKGCSDTGSVYGLVIEYGGNQAKVEDFVSTGATRQALQMFGRSQGVGRDPELRRRLPTRTSRHYRAARVRRCAGERRRP